MQGKDVQRNLPIVDFKDCLRCMQQGSEFIKLRRKNHRFLRYFWLAPSNAEIRWSPTSKKSQRAALQIANIREVRWGMNTELFRAHELARRHSENCAFAIMHGSEFESLEIIAKSAEIASIWVAGLTALMNESRSRKEPIFCLMSPPDSVSTSSESGDGSACTAYALTATTMTAALVVPIPIVNSDNLEQSAVRRNPRTDDSRSRWFGASSSNASVIGNDIVSRVDAIRLMKSLGNGLGAVRLRQKLEDLGITQRANVVSQSSDEHDSSTSTALDKFLPLAKQMFARPDVYFLLIRYSNNAQYLTVQELMNFMENEQGIKLTNDAAVALISKYEPSSSFQSQQQLTVDGLVSLLSDIEFNDIFDPKHATPCQDMTQPLTHYFISASHRTYLLQDQLAGPSGVDGYVNALRRGARYVEIDVYDGNSPSDDPEPIVYRGNTLTSKITFSSVLNAISNHAFQCTDYPLIVGLNNQCGLKQQLKVAKLLTAIFGDKLYKLSSPSASQNIQQLPSPESLRGRIIIKAAMLHNDCNRMQRPLDLAQSVSRRPSSVIAAEQNLSEKMISKRLKDGTVVEFGFITGDCDSDHESLSKRNSSGSAQLPRKEKKLRLLKELNDLSFLCSVRLRGADQPLRIHNVPEVCSLSEASALRLASSSMADELMKLSQRNLFCIFPNSSRIDSSNFDAQDFWNCGYQLVTMNFQSPGPYLDVYHGFFRKNGTCGYVLKPCAMNDAIASFNANLAVSAPDTPTQFLSVKVISAQNLPATRARSSAGSGGGKFPSRGLIVCQLFGVAMDRSEQSSRVFDQPFESFNVLIYETFHFLVSVPQLATLRLLVLDAGGKSQSDQFLAQASIPVECLRNGYRVVRLTDFDSTPLESSLFVHVSVVNHCNSMPVRQRATAVLRTASFGRDANAHRTRGRSHSPISRRATLNVAPSACPTPAHERTYYYDLRPSAREWATARQVGIKQADELFKQVWPDVERARELRDAIGASFTTLKQLCGLDMNASARHCLRYLIANVTSCPTGTLQLAASPRRCTAPLSVTLQAGQVQVVSQNCYNVRDVQVAAPFENIVNTANRLLQSCQDVRLHADAIVQKLSNAYSHAVELYAALPNLCESASLKGKRSHCALENFAWNVRAIKGQCEMLRTAKSESADIAQQICETVQSQSSTHSAAVCSGLNPSFLAFTAFYP